MMFARAATWKQVVAVSAACAGLFACVPDMGSRRAGRAELLTTSVTEDGWTVLLLSHSLVSVASGAMRADTLVGDLDIGGTAGTELAGVIDVSSFDDGSIAVLESAGSPLSIFSPSGDSRVRLGTRGGGGGEFRDSQAVASGGGHIVVSQARASQGLFALGRDGSISFALPALADGDWFELRGRDLQREAPRAGTVEDRTRRLNITGAGDILHMVHDQVALRALLESTAASIRPEAIILRYSTLDQRLDTIMAMPGVEVMRDSFGTGAYQQAVFGEQPVWTAAGSWLALGDGGSNEVNIRSWGERRGLRIRWPADSVPVREADRLAMSAWSLRTSHHAGRAGTDSPRVAPATEMPTADMPAGSALQRQARNLAGQFLFAPVAPQITAAYGTHDCLWLSGWNPSDFLDGTALTLVIFNVKYGKVERVVTIPRQGSRMRHVGRHGAYVSYRDELGRERLARYPVHGLSCLAGA